MLPITLLGSVFDANSLGSWIYEWTKFKYGNHHNATKVAAKLWQLLIRLGCKLQRARKYAHLIIGQEDFIKNGEVLWLELTALLADCEKYMWKSGSGAGSGAEFVEAMFSSQWRNTNFFMTNVRIWWKKFDI